MFMFLDMKVKLKSGRLEGYWVTKVNSLMPPILEVVSSSDIVAIII